MRSVQSTKHKDPVIESFVKKKKKKRGGVLFCFVFRSFFCCCCFAFFFFFGAGVFVLFCQTHDRLKLHFRISVKIVPDLVRQQW